MNDLPMRPNGTQKVTVATSSAATTNAVAGQTRVVRLLNDPTTAGSLAFVTFGKTPTATTGDTPLADGREEYFQINPGEKVAVIGTDGSLYVTEMTYG